MPYGQYVYSVIISVVVVINNNFVVVILYFCYLLQFQISNWFVSRFGLKCLIIIEP